MTDQEILLAFELQDKKLNIILCETIDVSIKYMRRLEDKIELLEDKFEVLTNSIIDLKSDVRKIKGSLNE